MLENYGILGKAALAVNQGFPVVPPRKFAAFSQRSRLHSADSLGSSGHYGLGNERVDPAKGRA